MQLRFVQIAREKDITIAELRQRTGGKSSIGKGEPAPGAPGCNGCGSSRGRLHETPAGDRLRHYWILLNHLRRTYRTLTGDLYCCGGNGNQQPQQGNYASPESVYCLYSTVPQFHRGRSTSI